MVQLLTWSRGLNITIIIDFENFWTVEISSTMTFFCVVKHCGGLSIPGSLISRAVCVVRPFLQVFGYEAERVAGGPLTFYGWKVLIYGTLAVSI